MDEERRALVRRLAADPQDPVAGPALARVLARATTAVGELALGRAALVVRAATPRPAFAWRAAMDKAIGKVAWIRSLAKDGLSFEVDVPDVGRCHMGAASLAPLPELGRRQSSGTFGALDGTVGPTREGRSLGDLQRMGNGLVEDEPGGLGPDGFFLAQRLVFGAVPSHEGASLPAVAEAAGFTAENNRSADSAFAYLYKMAEQSSRVRRPLVTLEAPILLPGATVPGPLDTGSWSISDLLVARVPGATELVEGLPWSVIAGVQTAEIQSPPHEPTEVADALVKLLTNPRAGLDEIFMIEGPDYPGGGEVGTRGDIGRLYASGAGRLRLRAAVALQLPARVVVTTPWPNEAREVFEQVVRDAVRAGRLDGVEQTEGTGELRVELARGAEPGRLESVRAALEKLLPLEQEASYKLPAPLVAWLRAFLDEKRRAGLPDPEIRRRILEARRHGGSGRLTRVF